MTDEEFRELLSMVERRVREARAFGRVTQKRRMALAYGLGASQYLAQTVKTTSTVDDHKRVGGCSHLEA